MAGPSMSKEDEEALRQMLDEAPEADLRSEGDPNWFADGAQVKLFGLKGAAHLNGETCEVVGFDNELRRYRLQLHSNGEIKKVGRKNMEAWRPPAAPLPSALYVPSNAAGASSSVFVPGAAPAARVTETALAVAAPLSNETALALPANPSVPSRDNVKAALAKVARDTSALSDACTARQLGIERRDQNICDVFLRINTAFETYIEIYELYKKAYGDDEELKTEGEKASKRFDEVVDVYTSVRTWTEMAQDEWNLTNYSIRKHGLVGTLKQEFVELGHDAVDLGKDAGELVSTTSRNVAPLVRAATGTMGDVVQSGSTAVASVTGSVLERSQRGARHVVEEQIVAPVKRAWHLLVTAFFICFIVPLFALRTYAPLNSVASNLGLVYSMVVITCPPAWARSRRGKAGLLILWPLVTVVLPLALHYWLMHPEIGSNLWGRKPEEAPEKFPALRAFRDLQAGVAKDAKDEA